jgi:hypothetical protein
MKKLIAAARVISEVDSVRVKVLEKPATRQEVLLALAIVELREIKERLPVAPEKPPEPFGDIPA